MWFFATSEAEGRCTGAAGPRRDLPIDAVEQIPAAPDGHAVAVGAGTPAERLHPATGNERMQLQTSEGREEIGAQFLDLLLSDALGTADRGTGRAEDGIDVASSTTVLAGRLQHGGDEAPPAVAAVLVLAGKGEDVSLCQLIVEANLACQQSIALLLVACRLGRSLAIGTGTSTIIADHTATATNI